MANSRAVLLATLGVVYGDIGTSPLYAFRECFHGPHSVDVTSANVLGVCSLVIWSLIVVISVKYLAVILRADNRGEGGILALMSLVASPSGARGALVLLGLFGAALLYGDGVITPAISVLSALEGLEIATPAFGPFVIPLAIVVLIGLFSIQRHGSARVGAFFGPVTLVWFLCLGLLGAAAIFRHPEILGAISPHHAIQFFAVNGWHGFVVLGSVFLVVTGGEALYADMGHFGRSPIRRVWFAVVFPALVLNYLGQGAILLVEPEAKINPFFHLAPSWGLYPLVVLSTAATIIASQAIITGAFSLTWQAVQLGFLPRVHVHHTSEDEAGQVFLPKVNGFMLVATIFLVLGFRTSSGLAAAYGIAVTTTMVVTTILAYFVMRRLWGWHPLAAGLATAGFLLIDLGFFGANLLKIAAGGWLPLAMGIGILIVMMTWQDGRKLLAARLRERSMTFQELEQRFRTDPPARVPGTAVYLTSSPDALPPALWRTLMHLRALHERVILLRVETVRVPYALPAERVTVTTLPLRGLHRVTVKYGFLERPHIPMMLGRARDQGLPIDFSDLVYVLGRETLLATQRPGMWLWRERLFAFLSRNAASVTEFFRLPPGRVIEIGAQIEL